MPDLNFVDFRGGRNGIDSPMILSASQCAEAINIDWEDGPLGCKRRGAVLMSSGVDLSIGVASMFRHVPGGDETLAEGWFVRTDKTMARLTTTGWTNITLADAMTSSPYDVAFCTFNGKLFVAYGSGVDRLHVWDGTSFRRVGLAAPGPPTAADQGSGTLTGARHYRIRLLQYDGTTITRRSEPSTAIAFTPSGTGSAVRVTLGTLPGEGETYWELEEADNVNGPWFVVNGTANSNALPITTTYVDDTISQGSFGTMEAALDDLEALGTVDSADKTGTYTLPTSVRYLSTDNNNLLMAGSYTAGGKTSRIWNTPALGSEDAGDDERIIMTDTIKGYVDLNEKDGGAITGISLPVNGYPLAFKYRQVWRLSPTGDPNAIYIPRKVSPKVGCIYFKTIVECEDANGNAMLAWLTHKGPWRMGTDTGLAKIGRDVDDIWFGRNSQSPVNLSASTVVAHGVYHTDRHQVWFFVSRGTDDSPSTKLMVDLRRNVQPDTYGIRGGWAIHLGKSCEAACSMVFSRTITPAMSLDLTPWVSHRTPV